MTNQLAIANRNIKLYVFIRIFAKRVFIPLAAIFFIENAGFTVRDIGFLAAFYSAVQLLVEIPTGYFADKVGRVASIRLGALSCMVATILYVVFSSKVGIFSGAFFEALGYSFLGGAGEALIHDSLIVKKLEHAYTHIMSKAMSISLIANAILVTLVPMTYAIDIRYPFIIGTLAYFCLFLVTLFMKDLNRKVMVRKFVMPQFSKIIGKRYIILFGITFGIISALYSSGTDMINIAMKEYGIRPDLLGWVFGIASVVGASIGPLIKYLRKIQLKNYLLLDLGVIITTYTAAYTRSALLLATIMILGISFFRYRKIVYQSYLLSAFPTEYKATLISTMNNLEQLNAVWLPLMITYLVYLTNTSNGLGLVAVFALIIAPIFVYSTLRFFKRAEPVPVPLANIATDIV